MKKVFHIISHFDVGGAEQVAANIAKSASGGYEYHVVELVRAHSGYTAVFMDELRRSGVRLHRGYVPDVRFHYVFERLAAVTFPLWFVWLFLKHRPAAIHCHTEMPDLAVWCFVKTFPMLARRCRVVRTIHNTRLWTGLEHTGRRVEKLFIRLGANVAISRAVQDNYEREYGQRPPIIYNGVPKTAGRRYEGLAEGKTNVLFAGRFEPQKGVATLIGIVKSLKGDSRFHFHIIGDGSLLADIERGLGGQENVSLRPPVHGLAAYLPSFSCLLMPSEFEGLSILSLEAGMAALPVVANNAPGLSDTLPEDWPLLARNGGIDEYVSLLERITTQTERTALGGILQKFVEENFGVRRMQEEYERIYARER